MFEGILGQERLKALLSSSIRKNQVSHAYLLTGPRGVGKEFFARTFAKAIACSGPMDKRPCGFCDACRRMEAGVYPDFLTLAPAEGKRSIAIAQVRELITAVSTKTFSGNARICLITQGETMTPEAQNALLKSLEEPEPGNVFLITTENTEKILPTIRSRCQVLPLEPLNDGEIRTLLGSRGCTDPGDLRALVAQAAGLPGRAAELLANPEDETLKKEAFSVFCAILRKESFPIFSFADAMGKSKERGVETAEYLITGLTGVMRALADPSAEPECDPAWTRQVLPQVDPVRAAAMADCLFELTRRLLTNANPRIQWEACLLKILEIQENSL